MMMIFGVFIFSLKTASYQQLQHKTTWRHGSNNRVGDLPASQFLGRGEDTISLNGSIVPEFGLQISLSALRIMADTGTAFPLIGGTGKIYGLYRIDDIQETQTEFFKDGKPRKIEFSMTLTQTMKAGTLVGNAIGRMVGLT